MVRDAGDDYYESVRNKEFEVPDETASERRRRDEEAQAEQERLEGLARRTREVAAKRKRQQSRRSVEIQQARERPHLTKDNSKAKKKRAKPRRGYSRVKKLAPGRKSKKKKVPKLRARVDQLRKTAHNDIVRRLKGPSGALNPRSRFVQFLGDRLLEDDIDADNWLDWIEGEVEQLRSTLYGHGLIKREE